MSRTGFAISFGFKGKQTKNLTGNTVKKNKKRKERMFASAKKKEKEGM